MKNFLQLPLADFKDALKTFKGKFRDLGDVLLAYESGFLSIESGGVKAVMHAQGEWGGRAYFSSTVLKALVSYPPSNDPVVISYADGRLLVGGLTIKCEWSSSKKLDHPHPNDSDIIGLLALEHTAPRAQVNGPDLGKKIRNAKLKAERRIKKAAEYLQELGVSEYELRSIVGRKIQDRVNNIECMPAND